MSESGPSARPDKAVCLFCRQRKVKCDRAKPSCGNCVRNGFTCKYVSEADRKRPGLRAGYVSQLERRLASVEQEIGRLTGGRPFASGMGLEIDGSDSSPFENDPAHEHLSHGPETFSLSTNILEDRPRLTKLCRIWFEKYHPWFPHLHQITLMEELKKECLYCSPHALVFRAIAVVTSSEKRSKSDALRDAIFLAVSKTLTLQSLQALLILTILDYGDGKLPQFYNLIAVCKRMSSQLGLRDLVAIHGGNFNKPSGSIPPRMLNLPENLVRREESIRAYWITEALDSASTIGAAWHLTLASKPKQSGFELLPCRDDIWTIPESIDMSSLKHEEDFSATFTLYVGLVCDVCYHVHVFLRTPFNGLKAWRDAAVAVEKKLFAWRDGHWQQNFLASPGGRKTPFVAISLVIACTFHLARVSLYQRLAFTNPFAASEETNHRLDPMLDDQSESGFWPFAVEQCLDSCNSIATDIQTATDQELEHINPQVSFCIYVAARFLLLLAKHYPELGKIDSSALDYQLEVYLHALSVCKRRWPYAERLGDAITTAIQQGKGDLIAHDSGELPEQFWDPQYLSLDVDEALRCWSEQVRHPFQ